jgi:glycosyltransferase involved in cell wall biosynthesis
MKILINTAHQRFGGAIQVALSFIYECRNFPEHEYFVWVGPGVGQSLREEDFPENFHFSYFDFGIITLAKTFRINRMLRKKESEIRPDVVIATSGPSYFHSRAPQVIGFNLPLYIYPESPFVRELSAYRKLRLRLKKHLHYYFFKRDAKAFVVQTEDVNRRVRKALNTGRVFTVTNTHNGFYDDWKPYPAKLPPKSEGEVRLLTLSAWYPHKNMDLIPEVLDVLPSVSDRRFTFVLTLSPDDFDRNLAGRPQTKNILNVGPVKPRECPSLYRECDIMFLPTLAECFSASYPEAMVMERPIVTTDLGFSRSICGDAALYFEPRNPVDAARRIAQLVSDDTLQDDLIRKGQDRLHQFDTSRRRAEKYLKICRELAAGSLDTFIKP